MVLFSINVKVVTWLLEATEINPPCALAIDCVIAKPSPTRSNEHPVLAFIEKYMKKITVPTRLDVPATVDVAFANFQRFGRNSNSRKMTCMTITQFQEAMAREHIDVAVTNECVPIFKSYCMRGEVPDMSNDTAISMSMRYEPPAVNANLLPQKRSRDEFNEQ